MGPAADTGSQRHRVTTQASLQYAGERIEGSVDCFTLRLTLAHHAGYTDDRRHETPVVFVGLHANGDRHER